MATQAVRIWSNGSYVVDIDHDEDTSNAFFKITKDDFGATLFSINENGAVVFSNGVSIDSSGVITGASIDHGATTGRDDDDHTQYQKETDFTAGSILFRGTSVIGHDNANLFWDNTNKRLGIGTASPNSKVHSSSTIQAGMTASASNYAGRENVLLFNLATAPTSYMNAISSSISGNPDNTTLDFELQTGASSRINVMTMTGNGRVGIVTTNPLVNLHVFGGTPANAAAPIAGIDVITVDAVSSNFINLRTSNNTATSQSGYLFSDNVRSQGGIFYIHRLSSAAVDKMRFYTNLALQMTIDSNGNVGIGTDTPTQPLSVQEKSGMSAIGGFCVKLTNKTGANSVAGNLVRADTATDDAVILTAATDDECMGVFLDSGVADGAKAWVVVAGIADVKFDDNVTAVRGNWVGTGQAGLARTQAAPPALGIAAHFEEVGHCVENVTAGGGGTFILARCTLQFN